MPYNVNPRREVKKRPTLYDAYGNHTEPSTYHYGINRRWLCFHARFYTQMDGYDASYAIGRRDAEGPDLEDQLTTVPREHEFSQELLGFDTSNQGNKQIPTMQIYVVGYRDWEQILQVNDYVALQVEEQYPDDPNWQEQYHKDPYATNGIERRTLMTGLISNIHMAEDAKQKGKSYVITCQGMQKVLNNINLGLPKTAQIASTNLLFDINGYSNPQNETFDFASGGGGTSASKPVKSSSNKGSAFGLSGVKGQLAKWLSDHGCNKAQIAGIFGTLHQESGFQLHARNPQSDAEGLFQITPNTSYSKGNRNSDSVASQCEAMASVGDRFEQYKKDTAGSSNPIHCSRMWGNDFEIGGVNDEGDPYADHFYHEMS